jgi:general secretion pathway protein J
MQVQRGFSLIEVLIAAGLLAALGIALFQLLQGGIRVSKTVTTFSSRYHAGRQAMERMTRELSMAYLSAQQNATEIVVQTNFRGKEEKVEFDGFGNVPFAKNAKESDQREVSYFIDRDRVTDKPALMRKIHNNLTLKLGEQGTVDVLCSDVKSLKFKYWDDSVKDWKTDWATDTSDAQVVLPARIQIELVIMISEQREQKFLTQVELWTRKPIMISK